MLYASQKILTEQGFVDGVIEVKEGHFTQIIPKNQFNGVVDVDYSDKMIVPGLIDIHLHGYKGLVRSIVPLEDKELEDFLAEMARQGTTACLPSIEPSNYPMLAQFKQPPKASRFLGLNLEAYFASQEYMGFRKGVPMPTVEIMKDLLERSNGLLKYIMIAPELPDIKETLQFLKSKGVKISAGHTLITAEAFKELNKEKFFDALTHTGNNMGQMHQRNVGVMGVGLLDPDIYCELITDFLHVSSEMIQIIIKVAGTDKTILVSDCVALGGMPKGEYNVRGHQIWVSDEYKIVDKEQGIHGCYFTLLQNTRKLIQNKIVSIEDAFKMGSTNPAKYFGLDDRLGSIKINKEADFLVLDHDLELVQTYIHGEAIDMNV